MRQMNYASILFASGVSVFKHGDKEKGLGILEQAKAHFFNAISSFNQNEDAIYLSQCYFLLGEISAHAVGDQLEAKEYYQKSVTFYAHPGSKAALEKITH